MKIETKYFGMLEIQEKDIIQFEHGIPGFPDEKQFIFLPLEDTDFTIMQSIQTSNLAFVTSSPFSYFKDYEIKLSNSVIEQLQLISEKEVFILVILNVQNPMSQTTANLVAPIVINTAKKMGKQVILENTSYKTRHQISNSYKETKEEPPHARP